MGLNEFVHQRRLLHGFGGLYKADLCHSLLRGTSLLATFSLAWLSRNAAGMPLTEWALLAMFGHSLLAMVIDEFVRMQPCSCKLGQLPARTSSSY
jgi:hypothetical protein